MSSERSSEIPQLFFMHRTVGTVTLVTEVIWNYRDSAAMNIIRLCDVHASVSMKRYCEMEITERQGDASATMLTPNTYFHINCSTNILW